MSQINIVTAQNVVLKIELANIGDRFLASVIDVLIKIGICLGSLMLLLISHEPPIIVLVVLIFLFALCFYTLVFEFFMGGQTPGKRTMEAKVARLDGAPLEFSNLMLRWLMRMVEYPTIGIVAIVATEKHQRIGDMAGNTIVVSTKKRINLEDTFYHETDQGYVPVFPEAERLTVREAEIIKEVLSLYRHNDHKFELITLTAAKVRSLLQADARLDDLTFLKTVLKDYNVVAANEGKVFDSPEGFSFSL